MGIDKRLMGRNTDMLVLKLMQREDMYGYQIIDALRRRSNDVFDMKAGTLYPLLHQLVQKGMLTSYEQPAGEARVRKYYHITDKGLEYLQAREAEWLTFAGAISGVLGGDMNGMV